MNAPPRYAVVPPYAAAWLLATLHARGVTSQTIRAEAQWRRENGHHRAAADLEGAWAQLQAARADHQGRMTPAARAVPASACEVGSAPAAPAKVPAPSQGQYMTTREAADALGLTTTQRVVQLIEGGHLSGDKRGRWWVVHVPSVEALADLRRQQR